MENRFRFRVPFFNNDDKFIGYEYCDMINGINAYNAGTCHKGDIQLSTGLKDRNGKLIYEGDLLRYPAKNQYEERCYTFFEVFWHDNDCCDNHIGWQMNRLHPMGGLTDCSRNHKFIPRITEQMEVIGNIYENKELLGDQK